MDGAAAGTFWPGTAGSPVGEIPPPFVPRHPGPRRRPARKTREQIAVRFPRVIQVIPVKSSPLGFEILSGKRERSSCTSLRFLAPGEGPCVDHPVVDAYSGGDYYPRVFLDLAQTGIITKPPW
jgi:hypothetical protein